MGKGLLRVLIGLAALGFTPQDNDPIRRPPQGLAVSAFYEKYLDAKGIPVLGSPKVPDRALREARDIVVRMVSMRPDVLKAMIGNGTRVAVMAETEVTTDIPEHRDLNEAFPGRDWNRRCRGVGGTNERPVCSAAEENLLGYASDRYHGENILVHEFGHTMYTMGIVDVDPEFGPGLAAAYRNALAQGLWKDTYAASNADEYWAEGVQDWFDTNLSAKPPNGIHNEIHTRDQLKKYDPTLAALLAKVFPDDSWRYPYPKKPLK